MKKLFSIVLMGAALFVSTNAKAVVVNDEAALRNAIAAGATIQLGGSGEIFTIAAPLDIEIDGAMILDLNGRNLEYAYNPEDYKGSGDTKRQQGRMINLKKGTLTIKNDAPATGGWIKNNTANKLDWSFGYYASAGATKLSTGTEIVVISVTGSTDPAAENYTVLNVNEGVKLSAPDGKVGIIVNAATGTQTIDYATYQYVTNSKSKAFNTQKLMYGCSFGVVVNMNGYAYGNKYGVQISGNNSAAPKLGMQYDFENIPTGVSFADAKAAAATQGYGAKGYKCNWAWAGDFVGVGAEALKDANFPKVNIGKTGECASMIETTSNGNGLYCAGYSETVIEGYCHGSNGVYVKAGDITINNALIESENPNYTTISGKTDREGAGNALVCESNASYPGETKVTIMGDTKLEAISGFAIEDKVTTATISTTDVIEIQGGTFIGGEEGGIITNTETEVVIENGNFSHNVDNYINPATNYTIITKDGTVVVNTVKPGEPTPPTGEWPSGDIAVSGQDFLRWDDDEKTQTISDNREVGYFDLEAGEVIVGNGATLTVDRLVMGSDAANIIVKVGGRLIVKGDMGIVANTVGNITIEAEENNMGQFLFNPAVTSNKHPLATVNFNSKAYNKTELVQFFGCPMVAGGMEKIESSNNTYESRFKIWRYDHWEGVGSIGSTVNIDYSKFDMPFGVCSVMGTNPSTDLLSYKMTGRLLGNTQPEGFRIVKGWTSAANSWTGDADPEAMIEELHTLGLTEAVYTYEQTPAGNIVWNGHDVSDLIAKVEPMQPILFENQTNKVITKDIMNYENLVWNFRNGAKAPVRATDFTKAIVRIENAKGEFDRVVVSEHSAYNRVPKYPNEMVRVYVSDDKEYDIFATENVENTYIGFNCAEAGSYKVTFSAIQGENLVLVDLVNNKQVAIVEGAEYEFEAKANEANPYRFQVRKIAEQATAVENVEAGAKAEGIYTIMGQYVGNDFNALPAGVYVFNGVKVVK